MPKMRSHEISLALDTRIRELGGDIWYQSEAETILADDAGRIRGVKLTDGKVIETRHVIGTIWELTFRRVDGEAFPFFRAGQYASIQVKIGDSLVSRPYSIVSSPRQALAGELVLAVENAGFVTAKLMEQYADVASSTFFLCGPQAMYDFVEKELAPYGLPKKAVHRDAGCCGDLPVENPARFTLTVHMREEVYTIPAMQNETLLTAMERAGLNAPNKCRAAAASATVSGWPVSTMWPRAGTAAGKRTGSSASSILA